MNENCLLRKYFKSYVVLFCNLTEKYRFTTNEQMHIFVIGALIAGLLMLVSALGVISFIEGYDLRGVSTKDSTPEGNKIFHAGSAEYVRGAIYSGSAMFLVVAGIILMFEILWKTPKKSISSLSSNDDIMDYDVDSDFSES